MTDPEREVILRAVQWWASRAPEGWGEEQHLSNVHINCDGERQHALATAVAELLRSSAYGSWWWKPGDPT